MMSEISLSYLQYSIRLFDDSSVLLKMGSGDPQGSWRDFQGVPISISSLALNLLIWGLYGHINLGDFRHKNVCQASLIRSVWKYLHQHESNIIISKVLYKTLFFSLFFYSELMVVLPNNERDDASAAKQIYMRPPKLQLPLVKTTQ